MSKKLRVGRVLSVVAIPVALAWSSFLILNGEEKVQADAPVNYERVVVEAGDTIWDLAKEHGTKGDVRDVLFEDVWIATDGEPVPYAEFDVSSLRPGTIILIEKEEVK